jgi:hypothetical protein
LHRIPGPLPELDHVCLRIVAQTLPAEHFQLVEARWERLSNGEESVDESSKISSPRLDYCAPMSVLAAAAIGAAFAAHRSRRRLYQPARSLQHTHIRSCDPGYVCFTLEVTKARRCREQKRWAIGGNSVRWHLSTVVQTEGVHHLIAWFSATTRRIERHCCDIRAISQHPGLGAANPASRLQYGTQKILSQTAALMRWRHANLVDPKLRAWLVWMNIVDCGHEADDNVVLNGDSEVVSAIAEKRIGHVRIDRIIKDVWRNVLQNARVIFAYNLDFNHGCAPAVR